MACPTIINAVDGHLGFTSRFWLTNSSKNPVSCVATNIDGCNYTELLQFSEILNHDLMARMFTFGASPATHTVLCHLRVKTQLESKDSLLFLFSCSPIRHKYHPATSNDAVSWLWLCLCGTWPIYGSVRSNRHTYVPMPSGAVFELGFVTCVTKQWNAIVPHFVFFHTRGILNPS